MSDKKKEKSSAPTESGQTPPAPNRIRIKYKAEVVPALMKKFSYKNVHQAPRLTMISLNMGVGEAAQNKAVLDNAVKDLTMITGRKPLITKARKSISNFKLRAGVPIGCKVTLRSEGMYQFLDKLVSIVIPRFRDFKGLPTGNFDGRGNYSLGIREQVVFPEIEYDKIDKLRGMNIVFVTTAKTDEEARELLTQLGLPFAKN